MKNKSVMIIVTAAWMGLIFYASSLPGSATGPDTLLWVFLLKTLHFINFGILALLVLANLKGDRPLAEIRFPVFIISLFLTILYAMSDEYHQKFSPGRHASIKDVVIDTMGATVFLGTSLLLGRKKKQKKGVCNGKTARHR